MKRVRTRQVKICLANSPRVCAKIKEFGYSEEIERVDFFPSMEESDVMASLSLCVNAALDEYAWRIFIHNPSSQQQFPFPEHFGTDENKRYSFKTLFKADHVGIAYVERLVLRTLPGMKGFNGLEVLSHLRVLEVHRCHNVTNAQFQKMVAELSLEELIMTNCDKLSRFEIKEGDRACDKMWKLALYFSEGIEGELHIEEHKYMSTLETNARHVQGRLHMVCLELLTINVCRVKQEAEVLEILAKLSTVPKKLDELTVEGIDCDKQWRESDRKLFCEAVAAFAANYVLLPKLTQPELRKDIESSAINVEF